MPMKKIVPVAAAAMVVVWVGYVLFVMFAPSLEKSAISSQKSEMHARKFDEAKALESKGDGKDAVDQYRVLAKDGHGKSAKRLGEIYDRGIQGIPRDYAQSLQWYEVARQLGEDVAMCCKR